HISGNVNSPFLNAYRNPNWPYHRNGYDKSNLKVDALSDIGFNNVEMKQKIFNTPQSFYQTKKWFFSQRISGLAALQELTNEQDGIQFWMDCDPGRHSGP